MSIKSVLKTSKSNDTPPGWPPTHPDLMNRVKHTSHSVEYNIFEYAEDHFIAGLAQLEKLSQVDRVKAMELGEKICKWLDGWYVKFEQHKPETYQRKIDD